MKFLIVGGIWLLILMQVDPGNSTVATINAIGEVIKIIGGILAPIIAYYLVKINSNQKLVATKVDGLLEEKTKATKALGVLEGIENAAKEKAIGDDRELKMLKEQKLKDEVPTSVKNLENEIRKKGDEIQKAVEEKGADIKDEVVKVPDLTAEEVVKKINPK